MRLLSRLDHLQKQLGYLPVEALRELAREMGVPFHRIQELVSYYTHFRSSPPPRLEMHVCRDLVCRMRGGADLREGLEKQCRQETDAQLHEVSCLGRCDQAPVVMVNDRLMTVQAAAGDRIDLTAIATPSVSTWRCDIYAKQSEHYRLLRELVADADAAKRILTSIKESGLRGMGGAGFPTGSKWDLVRQQQRTPKYVICNADESEPGTFKDREILRQLPHLVIESMALAGLTVGASEGILYIRHEHEYGAEQEAFAQALEVARRQGAIGTNIFGSDFSFDIEIFMSPGGYILGEETALLEALEDQRGEPRNKPPFPSTHGLHGQPTLINNVETLAFVPAIVDRGADWWKAQGKDGYAGLKFMAVSGHVERPGVYEVPMGTPVKELIDLAGGVQGGQALKAFAPGGASSRFLPGSKVDTPIDFAAMTQAGSMLGSGALVVVAEGTDMADLAGNVVRFFRNESCGKCVPCRVGTEKAVQHLDECQAKRTPIDKGLFSEMNETLHLTSICGLGQVALNPVLSVLEHWPGEFGS